MKFFEDQERARKESRRLLFIFFLATLFTALLTAFAVNFILTLQTGNFPPSFLAFLIDTGQSAEFYVSVAIVTFFVIACSTYKAFVTSGEGAKIAKSAGAVPVNLRSEDLKIRTYINVVQEMAIASGIGVPQIFIMPNEPSINAFAAGSEVNTAAVCVTEGALKRLTRDELQGVIAHEFGHIFNGDMKINTRLLSITFGLGCIYGLGLRIIRVKNRRISSSKSKGADFLIGLVFIIIGYFGMIMAKWILSLISQQREFLADAASVQYTRNPDGIGNVLKKIWVTENPYIQTGAANDINHFFLTPGYREKILTFKSHPSIGERLSRIYPNINLEKTYGEAFKEYRSDKFKPLISKNKSSFKGKVKGKGVNPSISLSKEVLDKAALYLSQLSESVRNGCNNPNESKKIILAILGHQALSRVAFQEHIQEEFDKNNVDSIMSYYENISSELFVPVLDLAIGSLKTLERDERKEFLHQMKKVIMIDGNVGVNELIIYLFVSISLLPNKKNKSLVTRDNLVKYSSLVISLLAHSSSPNDALKAFNSVSSFFGNSPHFVFVRSERIQFKEMFKALSYLQNASPYYLNILSNALLKLIKFDDRIDTNEYQIVHIYCQCLGIPTPFK